MYLDSSLLLNAMHYHRYSNGSAMMIVDVVKGADDV